MQMNIPNTLTILRIILIPVFVIAYLLPMEWGKTLAGVLFVLGALTDIFDGMIARRLNQTSAFGAFLDPVADKLAVVTALIMIVQYDPRLVVLFPVLIITGRELTISALREWMAELGKRANVAVSSIGKIKTVTQMTAISLMIFGVGSFESLAFLPVYETGLVLLYIASVLTLWSMIVYLKAAFETFDQ